ncbi:MAG: type transport system permease protein [Actinomycetota bacterium]|jgi:hypothetical protein|nr:type transport system permease protein [Actinomycetota bacterium]
MVAFIASLIVTGLLIGGVRRVAKRRAPGTPLTWGEGIVAAIYAFALQLMLYGVVPDRWLRWADNDLQWRTDKLGIPTGPLPFKHHLVFADGITFFGRGKIVVNAQILRDIIVATIYIVFLVGQLAFWIWWQRRGKRSETPELETSAYGRPLVRGTA